jgi:UDPglucose 6-dehydrogenase
VEANVQEVSRGIGLDNRIGQKFLNAGPGYGGSCFPKDTLALTSTANAAGSPLRIVDTVVAVNDARKKAMGEKVAAAMGGEIKGKAVAILGLAFKPNTDDMREAPALDIIAALQAKGAQIRAYDPEAMGEANRHLDDVMFCDGP